MSFHFTGKVRTLLSPWPTHDYVACAKSALQLKFILPYVGEVDFSNGMDWSGATEGGNTSFRLWLHSLIFVDDLAVYSETSKDTEYLRAANGIFESYWSWVQSNRQLAFADEHAVAVRTAALTTLLVKNDEQQTHPSTSFRSTLIAAIEEHGGWLTTTTKYLPNNHGVMMDRSLLQLSVLFETHAPEMAASYREVALGRLLSTARHTFDEDGCCLENSPGYHLLNVNLFNAVIWFCEDHGIDTAAFSNLREVLKKASDVTPLFAREDGTLVPVGDTDQTKYEYLQKGEGAAAFPRAGFGVVKTPDLHVTVKCGGATFVHRHVDDTSFTARYAGLDFIVDPGFYSYDLTDPVRRWMVQFRGHSGVFTDDTEQVRFGKFASPADMGKITGFSQDADKVSFEMQSTLLPGVLVRRRLHVFPPNLIVIQDQMTSETPKVWRQQFLRHPKAKYSEGAASIVLDRDDIKLELEQHSVPGMVPAREPAYFSEAFEKTDHTECLIYLGEGQEFALTTTLRFQGANDREVSRERVLEILASLSGATPKRKNLLKRLLGRWRHPHQKMI